MRNDIKRAKILLKSASKSFDKGEFAKALSEYSKAVRACEGKKIKSFEILLADTYSGVGRTLRSRGDLTKAKQFQDRAFRLYNRLAKENDKLEQKLALSFHYMGDILADVKQVDKALAYYRKELKIARRLYSKDKKKLSLLIYGLNGTASRLADKADFKAALSLLDEALRELNRASKNGKSARKNYPNLSWTYHIIGTTLLKKGELDSAISNLKKALSMRTEIAKKNARFIGALKNTLNKLGDAYSAKGKMKEARKYYALTLKIVTGKRYRKQVASSISSREKRQLKKKMQR